MMRLDPDYADMEFLLEDGTRRPAHKALVAAASDVIKTAMTWPGKTKFVYELAECNTITANVFIDILYGKTVNAALPIKDRFYVWVDLLHLAHRVNYVDIALIIYEYIEIADYKLYIETAKILNIRELIEPIAEIGRRVDIDGAIGVLADLDMDTLQWFLGVIKERHTYVPHEIITAAIVTRRDIGEQNQLLMYVDKFSLYSNLKTIAESLKFPVAKHLVGVIAELKK